jgi:predicted branched-subunit amino acid permease
VSAHTLLAAGLGGTSPAALTLGIALYSAAILVGIGVGINAASRGRRRLAAIMAAAVLVLVIAGVVVAILSSTH